MSDIILEVRDLVKHYPLRRTKLLESPARVRALNGVSFSIARGESFGLVGESGCGKTTAGHTIIKLLEPTGGKMFFEGEDITTIKGEEIEISKEEDPDNFSGYCRLSQPKEDREVDSERAFTCTGRAKSLRDRKDNPGKPGAGGSRREFPGSLPARTVGWAEAEDRHIERPDSQSGIHHSG